MTMQSALKLPNRETDDLYSSLNIILEIRSRWMQFVAYVACKGEKVQAWDREKLRCRWEGNIKMALNK